LAFSLLLIMITPWMYVKLSNSSAGFLPQSTISQRIKIVMRLAKERRLSDAHFCYTCGIQRPIRSKHDAILGRCAGRFDHHCVFTQSSVGCQNHPYFFSWLIVTLFAQGVYSYIAIQYIRTNCVMEEPDSFFLASVLSKITGFEMIFLRTIYHCTCQFPWIGVVTYWSLLHFGWELLLLFFQFYLNIIRAQTTNEFWNAKKYEYFWKKVQNKQGQTVSVFSNPFSVGIVQNFLSFFTPYGTLSNVDYTNLYSIVDLKKSE